MGPTKSPRGLFSKRPISYYDHESKRVVSTGNFSYYGKEGGVFTSVNTPGYRSIPKSKLPVNPHYWSRDLVLYQSYFYQERYNWQPLRTYKNQSCSIDNGIDTLCPYAASAVLSPLSTDIRLKIKNSDFNAGVALGEFRETSKFLDNRIGNIVRKLASAASVEVVVKKKKRYIKPFIRERGTRKWIRNPRFPKKKWPDVPRVLSDHWLEYSYAYLPLLQEIDGAAKTLAELPYAAERRTVRARLGVERPFAGSYSTGIENWKVIAGTQSVSREIGVHFNVSNPLLKNAAMVGLTNPLSIAYELTRLSFVVDWFLPIGNAIDALDATLGCTFTKGFQTTVWYSRSSAQVHVDNSGIKTDGYVEIRRKIFQRVVLNDFPGVSLPRPRLPSYLGQAASGIALLHQLFRK